MSTYIAGNGDASAIVNQFAAQLELRHPQDMNEEVDLPRTQLRDDLLESQARKRREELRRIEGIKNRTRSNDEVMFARTKNDLIGSMRQFQGLVMDPSQRKASLPATWEDVEAAVSEVQSQWETRAEESKVAQAKGWLRKMGNGMNNHSAALRLLPMESEYFSIVGGSVSMIIKASANHVAIGESFAKGVVEINDAVNLVQKNQVYQTPDMAQLVMRLYTGIFTYLSRFMTWFTEGSRKRCLHSFNETALGKFQQELEQVKGVSCLIAQEVQSYMSADVKTTRILQEESQGDTKHLLRLHEQAEKKSDLHAEAFTKVWSDMLQVQQHKTEETLKAIITGYHDMLRREISASAMSSLLRDQCDPGESGSELAQTGSSGGDDSSLGRTSSRDSALPAQEEVKYSSESTELMTRQFEAYFDPKHIFPFLHSSGSLIGETSFVARIDTFTTAMKSEMLYAHTPFRGEASSLLRQSIATYISLAKRANAPVVSYFCSLSQEEPPENRTAESVELCGLLYALTRQVVTLLPRDSEVPASVLNSERLGPLDGTLRTWAEAVGLFVDLVECAKLPLLFIVVDGLNLLEDDFEHSTDGRLESLVDCFRKLVRSSAKDGRIVKMLFTTAGLSGPLRRELDDDEMMLCEESVPGRRKKRRKARQIIAFNPQDEDDDSEET